MPRAVLLVCLTLPLAGCMVNSYSSDPNERITQLIKQSDELREVEKEVERLWMSDQPSRMPPASDEKVKAKPAAPAALPVAGAALGSAGPGAAVGAIAGALADKPPVTAAARLRPAGLLTRMGLGPKSKFAPAYKGWLDGIGVPLDAVEEVTVVWAGETAQSVHVVANADVDPKAVTKACAGHRVAFDGKRSFVCSPADAAPLPARVKQQLESAGRHDFVLWADAALLNQFGGAVAVEGVRDGTLALDLGDAVEAAARLNFRDEDAAAKGAKAVTALLKMARMMLLQASAQVDLLEASPKMIDESARDEAKVTLAAYAMLKNVEPALFACKPVARGTTVPLYVRVDVPARKLGEAVCLVEDKDGSCDKEPLPGLFFGPKVKGTTVEVPRPVPAAPIKPAAHSEPAPPPLTPPVSASLTVANVHKEPVSLFAVKDGALTFLRRVPAGEAVDVTVTTGTALAATFAAEPHCANYVVAGKGGETWLLRPAALSKEKTP